MGRKGTFPEGHRALRQHRLAVWKGQEELCGELLEHRLGNGSHRSRRRRDLDRSQRIRRDERDIDGDAGRDGSRRAPAGRKARILAMPRDQNRAAAMIAAIAAVCKLLGFGATFEGQGHDFVLSVRGAIVTAWPLHSALRQIASRLPRSTCKAFLRSLGSASSTSHRTCSWWTRTSPHCASKLLGMPGWSVHPEQQYPLPDTRRKID